MTIAENTAVAAPARSLRRFARLCGRVAMAASLAVLPSALAACSNMYGADHEASASTSALSATAAYPFGARLDGYRFGIRPNHLSAAQMDARIKARYDAWKSTLVVDVPTIPGGKAVKFSPSYITVSEGIGYGMLLAVLMAGHDPDAQPLFDGLLKTARARPAYSIPDPAVRPYLMDWRLTADGSSTDAAGGGWNALDGDEDIAMALLMADRQWGSRGTTWNYKMEGIRTINAMKAFNMRPDGTTMANPRTSRTSDYMIGHFRAYAAATGDSFWMTAIDRSFELVDRMQRVYSPGVGLVPDFIVNTDSANPSPSPGGQIESAWEGNYFANAQRNPWRWGTDYVFSGDARWKTVLTRLTDFFVKDNGGTPGPAVSSYEPIGNMYVGYHLDGSPMKAEFPNPWPAKGLVESELFGHVRGAFTGAHAARTGAFEEASGGTIFLDEVGELPLDMQPKLLRVLESGTIKRVGDSGYRPVDVRVVAATHRDVPGDVLAGRFRADLYYRLSVIVVRVPPLRERTEDIALLVRHFAEKLGGPGAVVGEEELRRFQAYAWPGNVRELKNEVERALVLPAGGPAPASMPPSSRVPAGMDDVAFEARRVRVVEALARRAGNQTLAARDLGISRRTLLNWLDEHNVPRPRKAVT